MILPAPAADISRFAASAGVAAVVADPSLALTLHTDLASVETVWRAFEVNADCTPFQMYAWHKAWQDNVGQHRGTRPAIVVVRHRGRLALILPLASEATHFGRRLVWHAGDLCDYNGPLLAPDFDEMVQPSEFAALWQAVVTLISDNRQLRSDFVVLQRMPERIGRQRNPFLALAVTSNPTGAHHMTMRGPWEQFYRDKRSSATRRHDRSKRKRLSDYGDVRLYGAESACEARAILDALFEQKRASFAARGVPDFLARPGTREFFKAAAADPSLAGVMHVSRLAIGESTAAANLGLVFRGRYYHVLASYQAGDIARFGPGTAHLHDLMDYALTRGCSEFDFTIGDETYKRDWCDVAERLVDYRAGLTAPGALAVRLAGVGIAAKRVIKQSPTLWAAFSHGRRWLRYLIGGRAGRAALAAAEVSGK
jgi:CelD/BcsL family acetyltransferase involved in cellulose biosynthesis